MPFLPPNQQRQSTEDNYHIRIREKTLEFSSTALSAPSPYLVNIYNAMKFIHCVNILMFKAFISNVYIDTFVTSAKEVMFSLLFVCLFVSNFVQQLLNRFALNFRAGWQWASEQTIKFGWRSGSGNRIRITTLVRRALAEVCTVPVLLVFCYFSWDDQVFCQFLVFVYCGVSFLWNMHLGAVIRGPTRFEAICRTVYKATKPGLDFFCIFQFTDECLLLSCYVYSRNITCGRLLTEAVLWRVLYYLIYHVIRINFIADLLCLLCSCCMWCMHLCNCVVLEF